MFKSLVALALLATFRFAVDGHELARLAGTWHYVRIYPKTAESASVISKITAGGNASTSIIPMDGTFECACDGAPTSFPAVDITIQTRKHRHHVSNYPTVVARSTDRADDLMKARCQCSVFKNALIHPVVFRFVNEGEGEDGAHVVEYDRHFDSVSLLSKRYSSAEETRRVIESDAELKQLDEELGQRRLSFGNIL